MLHGGGGDVMFIQVRWSWCQTADMCPVNPGRVTVFIVYLTHHVVCFCDFKVSDPG